MKPIRPAPDGVRCVAFVPDRETDMRVFPAHRCMYRAQPNGKLCGVHSGMRKGRRTRKSGVLEQVELFDVQSLMASAIGVAQSRGVEAKAVNA